ncbi:MAG TPA: hypothetical protein VMS11_05360 [Solirubrobacterales bacterium]|nr:hypothetical protein [Solirubrobacterales bacterium]
MIAAARGRIGEAAKRLSGTAVKWSRRADRAANRGLERTYPLLARVGRGSRAVGARTWALLSAFLAWAWLRLRPLVALCFRALALAEAGLRRACAALARTATAASAVITPQRALGAVVIGAGLLLVVSQFIDYRAVEIGQPAYADLGGVARPPTVDVMTAGEAHAFLLVPVGLLAAALGAVGVARSRPRLGLVVAALGLVSVAVILLVDRPAGLDAGTQASRFAGATAVLEDGFYAELAAAGGLVLCGLLYYARPCLIRISSSGRAASARRRRPRRPVSSPAKVARSA